jgi:hypothetical protein
MGVVARAYDDRAEDFVEVWGSRPGHGFGVAVNGGLHVPTFREQDWIGCNFYVTPDQSPATVHRLYADAAATGLKLMPVLGIYSDSGLPLQSLAAMGAAYLPPLERYREQMPFGGIFCYSHPDRATGARGLRELPAAYQAGEAYVLGQYGNGAAREAVRDNPFTVKEGEGAR